MLVGFPEADARGSSAPTTPTSRPASTARRPEDAAKALIAGTKLADPAVRKQLVDGGEAAVATSTDTLHRAGPQARPHGPRDAEVAGRQHRERRPAGRREDRPGPLRRVRQDRLPRRHLHPAPLLRHGQGLSHERHHRPLQDHLLRPLRPVRWASTTSRPSTCPSAWPTPATSSTSPRR